MLFAPGRLSTTIGWPSGSGIFCVTMRVTTSVMPPAGVGHDPADRLVGISLRVNAVEATSRKSGKSLVIRDFMRSDISRAFDRRDASPGILRSPRAPMPGLSSGQTLPSLVDRVRDCRPARRGTLFDCETRRPRNSRRCRSRRGNGCSRPWLSPVIELWGWIGSFHAEAIAAMRSASVMPPVLDRSGCRMVMAPSSITRLNSKRV